MGTHSTRKKLLRLLESDALAWKDTDYPELANGAAPWVRSLREENEQRLGKAKSGPRVPLLEREGVCSPSVVYCCGLSAGAFTSLVPGADGLVFGAAATTCFGFQKSDAT
jgi:hypothetical protein